MEELLNVIDVQMFGLSNLSGNFQVWNPELCKKPWLQGVPGLIFGHPKVL